LPGTGEEQPVAVSLAGPCFKLLDRLGGLGAIQLPAQVFAPDDAEYFNVHDVWGGVIGIRGQPIANRLGSRTRNQHLT